MFRNRIRYEKGIAFILLTAYVVCLSTPSRAGEMKKYDTPYYVLYTDLSEEKVLESIARLKAMVVQYHNRTKVFGGSIDRKLPFYLYSSHADYKKTILPQYHKSSGVYTGTALRAVADTDQRSWQNVWHVVQHEGFHQFAHMVIGKGTITIPVWVHEGLAEYFGEAHWTGDRLMTGFIYPPRLQRLRKSIEAGEMKSFEKMLSMDMEAWNKDISITNYDRVWSMMHFFAHAKNGKYRQRIASVISSISMGTPGMGAFYKYFGKNLNLLEKEYTTWWTSLDKHPTADLYDQLMLEKLIAFMARSHFQRVRFENADDFFKKAREGKLDLDPKKDGKKWLPRSLLKDALTMAARHKNWNMKINENNCPMLILKRKDGTVFDGDFIVGRTLLPVARVKITKPR